MQSRMGAQWPMVMGAIVPVDKAASAEAAKFFKWAFAKGGKMAEELDCIPTPDPVVKLIEKTWSADIRS
jgi:phosphate transport system substrate-binding protein